MLKTDLSSLPAKFGACSDNYSSIARTGCNAHEHARRNVNHAHTDTKHACVYLADPIAKRPAKRKPGVMPLGIGFWIPYLPMDPAVSARKTPGGATPVGTPPRGTGVSCANMPELAPVHGSPLLGHASKLSDNLPTGCSASTMQQVNLVSPTAAIQAACASAHTTFPGMTHNASPVAAGKTHSTPMHVPSLTHASVQLKILVDEAKQVRCTRGLSIYRLANEVMGMRTLALRCLLSVRSVSASIVSCAISTVRAIPSLPCPGHDRHGGSVCQSVVPVVLPGNIKHTLMR